MAKIYNVLLLNHIEPEIEKILRKNQNGFQRKRSMTSQILTIHQILEEVCAKNLKTTLLLVDFSKAFDSIHRRKMEQILLAYNLPEEILTGIMMLYKNTKVKVPSLDVYTDFFDIARGVLQGDTLAQFLFIICLDDMLWMSIDLMKENSFTLAKARSRQYPTHTIMDTDYIDDIALLANTPAQAKSLLKSLKRAAGSIDLHVKADKQSSCAFIKEATSPD